MDKQKTHGECSSNRAGPLDVKPLRSLRPMLPAPFAATSVFPLGGPPFVITSPLPAHSEPQHAHPFSFSPDLSVPRTPKTTSTKDTPRPRDGTDAAKSTCAPLPQASAPKFNGTPTTFPNFLSPSPLASMPLKGSERIAVKFETLHESKGNPMDNIEKFRVDSEGETSKSKQKRKRPQKMGDVEPMVIPSSSEDPKELVEVILMTFDALRRRIIQMEEALREKIQAVMKAGNTMSEYNLRANKTKRIGHVPGIEVGDIFYFRMEILLVGLHAQIMSGIDTMNTKFGEEDDCIAVSIVSSGGYEDESDDVNSLVYTGQGGKASDKKQADDQKLERGNLALERSLRRANEIRVIRGIKDMSFPTGKIFVYDGLYKLHESWVEKGKTGFNVFKYRLLRQASQPDAFATWKMIERWRADPISRGTVILPDLSSGEENVPVCLVNDVDAEKGPSPFQYVRTVNYVGSTVASLPLQACSCQTACIPGDSNCACMLQNGDTPYTSDGLLVRRKPMIYECSPSCLCSGKCRNKVTQKGIKFHFEVFRTSDRGWGLRSWNPIRAGSFLCEYVGEVMDKINTEEEEEDGDFLFEDHFDDKPFLWNYGPELLGEPSTANLPSTSKLPIIINAKRIGNVARFMNHSCSPNVFWQPVQHDHGDSRRPHIMFFASKHIPPMTELTYDYGLSVRDPRKCLCGSSKCRGSF